MANSSPEGIELGKGSKLLSMELSINKEKVLSIKQKETLEEAAENIFENLGYGFTSEKSAFINSYLECVKKMYSDVTRVEVIQHSEPYNGRAYSNYNAREVEVQLQDDGKTIKIFLK